MTVEAISGVVVIGAGYAGMHAARAAAAEGVAVTIVDADGVHGFTTRLAAVAGETAAAGDAYAPLEAFDHAVRPGSVVNVRDGIVELEDGVEIDAEALVVATGAEPVRPDIPGLDLAFPIRTPADALQLRSRLAGAPSVSIVGGGPTGVQFAGAIARSRPEMEVRIFERETTLLSNMDISLAERAQGILERRGVEVHLEAELAAVDDEGLELTDGRTFAGPVVWAAGFAPATGRLGDDLPRDEGALKVDEYLRVVGCGRTFAAGDIAAHRRSDGRLLPMSAQVAVQAGAVAGANAARVVGGRGLESADLVHRGWVLDIGGGRGVARVGKLPLAAPVVDRLPALLHYGIDIRHLVKLGGTGALRFRPGAYEPARDQIDDTAGG